MRLPNGQRAVADLAKLQGYCLSSAHKEGKFKARVFLSALKITDADAPLLQHWLLDAAAISDGVVPGLQNQYGTRYTLDFVAVHHGRTARIRSAWIVRVGEGFPRLITCFVI